MKILEFASMDWLPTIGLAVASAVLVFAGLVIGFAFWKEFGQRKKTNQQLKKIADILKGQCIDNGTWTHPLIVIDHAGLRTRISLTPLKIFDQTGTSMLQVKQLILTTDGYDPQLRMSVIPTSLQAKASAWVRGNRIESGRAEFDRQFVIASNFYRDAMQYIISPEVASRVLEVSRFEPSKPGKNAAGKTSLKDVPAKDSFFERKRRKLPGLKCNLESLVRQINKHRFRFTFEKGISEFKLLIHESEIESLEKLLLTMVDVQREVASNVLTLGKGVVKKPDAAMK